MTTLWSEALAELRQTMPQREYTVWIECLRTSGGQEDTLTVEAPSAFHRNWVREHYLRRIEATLQSVAGRPVPVSLAVGTLATGTPAPQPIRVPNKPPSDRAHARTFDMFVVGPCNELAYLACRAAAASPGSPYNPLVIHGGVGLGKTHLIHAIANAVRAQFRNYRVLAIGAEFFLNEMVSAVKRQQMETFHHRFRRVDMLLVDDVQFIAGKERTQEEFLHTFNRLCGAGKQIVLTSDKPPAAIPKLETGLRSRFEGGMIAEVTQPDFDTRKRILEQKAAQSGLSLPEEVTTHLAERIRAHSVRELEGTITRLRAMATLSQRSIDLELAREAVSSIYAPQRERTSVDRVETVVSEALDLEQGQLKSAHRNLRVVFARQVAMYLLKKLLGLSLATIGERYGRDHTTVLHAVRTIEARRRCNAEVRRLVMTLEEKL
jgi:chromosomal replication initiator protein